MVFVALHQLIEQSRWDSVLELLGTDPSSHEQSREPHRQDLPLHMACERHAPPEVIMELLRVFPEACRHKGRGENLPLHVAAHRNHHVEVLEAIIRAYPEALDHTNEANFTPRRIGHSDIHASQSLRRPTCCWHQLQADEGREEHQEKRLQVLFSTVDAALERVEKAGIRFDRIEERLDEAGRRLEELEKIDGVEEAMEETISQTQSNVAKYTKQMENHLTMIEDDIDSAATKESMAKAASRAHQEEVFRLQRSTVENSKCLKWELAELKSKIQLDPLRKPRLLDIDTLGPKPN